MGKQKLYCYVDETGQDTEGELFIVSVVITKQDREEVIKALEKFEKETGKGKTKWIRTKNEFKVAYLERILSSKMFKNKIYYSLSKDTKSYKEMTLITIASAITAAKDQEYYQALVYIDGLSKSEIPKVGSALRKIGIHTEKVRGIKDEDDAVIRLADAISGLIREQYQGISYTKKLCKAGEENKTLIKV